MKLTLYLFVLLASLKGFTAPPTVYYQLEHFADSTQKAVITIRLENPVSGPLIFSMPRSAPGTYSVAFYEKFIRHVTALSSDGKAISAVKQPYGPRWLIGDNSVKVNLIRYEVDLKKMEAELDVSQSSKTRKNYTSILNYSVFGVIPGMENYPVRLTIATSPGWQIFSTIAPSSENLPHTQTIDVAGYAQLADGQTVFGTRFRVQQYKDAPVPLFVVLYSETYFDIDLIGAAGIYCLNSLKNYFDTIPFSHYTIYQEYLIPGKEKKEIGFTMEHFNSATAFLDTSMAYKPGKDTLLLFRLKYNLLHHIGHAWIPLRCHEENYKPYPLELAPVQDAIWAHEGFIRFVCLDIMKRPSILSSLQKIVDESDDVIRQMSMIRLSQLASTQYSADFRIGMSVFARGGLMAYEMDQLIRNKTGNKQSFRDALRHLFYWSQRSRRGFSVTELGQILQEGIHADILPVYNKWLKAPE